MYFLSLCVFCINTIFFNLIIFCCCFPKIFVSTVSFVVSVIYTIIFTIVSTMIFTVMISTTIITIMIALLF